MYSYITIVLQFFFLSLFNKKNFKLTNTTFFYYKISLANTKIYFGVVTVNCGIFINYLNRFFVFHSTSQFSILVKIEMSKKKILQRIEQVVSDFQFNEAVFRLNWFAFRHYLSLHLIRLFFFLYSASNDV